MASNWYAGLGRVAREAGLNVIEEAGARTRGHGGMDVIESIIIHHTAGAWTGADYNSRTTVLHGHAGAKGPLAQYGIGRNTGNVYWFAAGLCAHAGKDSLVLARKFRNVRAIGIEIENNGLGEPYGAATYRSAVALTGQLVLEFGLKVSDVVGHKEIALTAAGKLGRKTDPSFDMNKFRADVTAWIATKNAESIRDEVAVIKEEVKAMLTDDQNTKLNAVHNSTSAAVINDSSNGDKVTVAGALQRLLTLVRRQDASIRDLHTKVDALIAQHTVVEPAPEEPTDG